MSERERERDREIEREREHRAWTKLGIHFRTRVLFEKR